MHTDVVYTVGAVAIGLVSVGFCILLQDRLSKISSSSEHNSVVLPLAKTVADLIDSSSTKEETTKLLSTLEDTKFRAISITVFSEEGEIWMDTAQPPYGKVPSPPTERQETLFRLICEERKKEEKRSKGGFRTSLYRSCHPNGSGEKDVTAVGVCPCDRHGMIVACQACGSGL